MEPTLPGGDSYESLSWQIDSLMSRMQRGTFIEHEDPEGHVYSVAVPAHHEQAEEPEEGEEEAEAAGGRRLHTSGARQHKAVQKPQHEQEQDALRAVGISNKLRWESSMMDEMRVQLRYSCPAPTPQRKVQHGVLELGSYSLARAGKPKAGGCRGSWAGSCAGTGLAAGLVLGWRRAAPGCWGQGPGWNGSSLPALSGPCAHAQPTNPPNPPPPHPCTAGNWKVCVHQHGGQWDGQSCTVYQYLSRLAFRLAQHPDGTWSVVRPPPPAPAATAQGHGNDSQAAASPAGASQQPDMSTTQEATGNQVHEHLTWHRIGLWGGQRGEPAFMPLHAEYAPHVTLLHARDPALLGERIRSRVYVGVRSADRMYAVGCALVALGCLVLGVQVVLGVLGAFRQRKAAGRQQQPREEEEEQELTLDELGKLVLTPNLRIDVECF